MVGTKHVVRQGDTLWDLAQAHLGDPRKWPLILAHNNSQGVVQLTGTRIADPDLIFVGQTIYLPDGNSKTAPPPAVSARPKPPGGDEAARRPARRTIYSVPLKYKLDDLPSIKQVLPHCIVVFAYKGSVTIQSEKPLDFATFSQSGIEIKAKQEADQAYQKLVNEWKVEFDPISRRIKFECGFTIKANSSFAPSVGAAAGISSETGLPCLKTSFKAPKLKGRIGHHVYVAHDLGVEVEVTPVVDLGRPRPRPQPQWQRILGTALIVTAATVVVATIVEDILTAGVGVADDPASFAAASAMFARGLSMARAVRTAAPIVIQSAGPIPQQVLRAAR